MVENDQPSQPEQQTTGADKLTDTSTPLHAATPLELTSSVLSTEPEKKPRRKRDKTKRTGLINDEDTVFAGPPLPKVDIPNYKLPASIRLTQLRRQKAELLRAVRGDATHPGVLHLDDLINEALEQYDSVRKMHFESPEDRKKMELMDEGERILKTMEKSEDDLVLHDNEILLTGGHLGPVIALLQQRQAPLINSMRLHSAALFVDEERGERTGFAAAFPTDELIDYLGEHQDDNDLLHFTLYMIQQELSNQDTIKLLDVLQSEETRLQKIKGKPERKKQTETIAQAKRRVIQAQQFAANVRKFISQAQERRINMDSFVNPLQLPNEPHRFQFTEGVIELTNRNLLEGKYTNLALRDRIDQIRTQLAA